MIENIKRILNEHQTLIVVIISVLVICFLYWFLCCKDRPLANKVKGGEVGKDEVKIWNITAFYTYESLSMNVSGDLLCWMLTSNGEILIYKNIVLQKYKVFNKLFFNEKYCYLPNIISSPVKYLLSVGTGTTLTSLFPIHKDNTKTKKRKKGSEKKGPKIYPEYIEKMQKKIYYKLNDVVSNLGDEKTSFNFENILRESELDTKQIIYWYKELSGFLRKYGGDFVVEANYVGQPGLSSRTDKDEVPLCGGTFTNINDVNEVLEKIESKAIDTAIDSLLDEINNGKEATDMKELSVEEKEMKKILEKMREISAEVKKISENEGDVKVLKRIVDTLKVDGKIKEIKYIYLVIKNLKNEINSEALTASLVDIESMKTLEEIYEYLNDEQQINGISIDDIMESLRSLKKHDIVRVLSGVKESSSKFRKYLNEQLYILGLMDETLEAAKTKICRIKDFLENSEDVDNSKNETIRTKIKNEVENARINSSINDFYCYSETKNKMFDEQSNENTYSLCNDKIRDWYSNENVKKIINKVYSDSRGIEATWRGNSDVDNGVADVYPAFKVILMLYFLVYLYPFYVEYSGSSNPNNYYKMIASYLVFVQLFNSFCACRMESGWNTTIKNTVIFGFKNVNRREINLMNLNDSGLESLEAAIVKEQIKNTIRYSKFCEELQLYKCKWNIKLECKQVVKGLERLGNLMIDKWKKKQFVDVNLKYTDILHRCEDFEKHCHRIVLTKHSKFFLNLFVNDPKNDVVINVDSRYFIKLLHFMYGEEIEIKGYKELFQIYNVVCIYEIDEVLKSYLEGLINQVRSFYCTDINDFINFHLLLKEELSGIEFNKVGMINEKTGETVRDLVNKILGETNSKVNSCINGNEKLLDSWSTDDTLSAQENKEQSNCNPLGNTIEEEEGVEEADEKNDEEQKNKFIREIESIDLSDMVVREMGATATTPNATPPINTQPPAPPTQKQIEEMKKIYPNIEFYIKK